MTPNPPRVGVAAIIIRDNRVLLIQRKGPHGQGTWSTPGGHLEWGESPEQCAVRETMEEVGLEIDNVQFAALTNDIFEESGKHYITLWMVGACSNGEPTINAVEEVSDLGWFEWDALPHPLFLPLENLINRRGYPAEAVSVISGPK